MSKTIQPTSSVRGKVFLMPEAIGILTVEKDDGDGLIATFSDGTTAGICRGGTPGTKAEA